MTCLGSCIRSVVSLGSKTGLWIPRPEPRLPTGFIITFYLGINFKLQSKLDAGTSPFILVRPICVLDRQLPLPPHFLQTPSDFFPYD